VVQFSRSAFLTWHRDSGAAAGTITAGSGAFSAGATFPAMRGEAEGSTTPEEMLAASHAICYGIGLRSLIARRGGRAERVSVAATVTAEKNAKGIRIVSSHLDAEVVGLVGLDEAALQEIGAATEEGCTSSLHPSTNVAARRAPTLRTSSARC
jgi:lipoyl-dependent peroxiredoxin